MHPHPINRTFDALNRSPSNTVVVCNIVGYLLYPVLLYVAWREVYLSFFFAMATDACYDSACDASYHVWPAMLTIWIGVGMVLLLTLVVMLIQSIRGKIILGWPFVGLLAFWGVYALAMTVLH